MKKQFLLVGTIIAMTISAMFMGCTSKNDAEDSSGKPENGCKCTFTYDGEKDTDKIDLDDMEEYYDVTTCSKLEKAIMKEAEGYLDKVSCKAY